jgi:hypothetical protein
MRNNKILASAIASVLSLGAGPAFADTLELRYPGADGVPASTLATTKQDAKIYGAELFSNKTTSLLGGTAFSTAFSTDILAALPDGKFVVAFKIGVQKDFPIDIGKTVNVKATLSQGTWAGGIIPTDSVLLCGTAALDGAGLTFVCPVNANEPTLTGVQILKGSYPSGDGDSIADFNIFTTGDSIKETAHLFFSFGVDDLTALKDGGSLSITVESSAHYGGPVAPQTLASPETIEIAKMQTGIDVVIEAETTPKMFIDVDQGLKGFLEGSSTQKDTACLGTLSYKARDGNIYDTNGYSSFDVDTSDATTATFTVVSAPLAASSGAVFLDPEGILVPYSNSGNLSGWDSSESIIAKTITSSGAVWELTGPMLSEIKDASNTPDKMRICLKADGKTEINEQTVAPTGTFVLSYKGGSAKPYSPRRLRHLKNNGSNCTLYNVPDGTTTPSSPSLDKIRIKIHNRSTTKVGTLRGTLIDQNGNVLFNNQNLLPAEDTLGPGKTINLNTGEGDGFDIAKLATRNWTGERAILKLTSNLQEEEFEAFAYVRSASGQSVGNLSTGATGSGCK